MAFSLYEDAQQYTLASLDPARLSMPILIFQGRQDDVVDPAAVEEFARDRENVTLRLLDDGHQLQHHLEQIWTESAAFLGVGADQRRG